MVKTTVAVIKTIIDTIKINKIFLFKVTHSLENIGNGMGILATPYRCLML